MMATTHAGLWSPLDETGSRLPAALGSPTSCAGSPDIPRHACTSCCVETGESMLPSWRHEPDQQNPQDKDPGQRKIGVKQLQPDLQGIINILPF